jgi:FdhD protein
LNLDSRAKEAQAGITHRPALKWRERVLADCDETLAVEEPLEIRLGGRRFTLTMRTPGNDEELVAGFLFAEGFIGSAAELGEIRRVRDRRGKREPNAIDVLLNVPAAGLRERLKRNFAITASCGVCGKTSIDSIMRRIEPLGDSATIAAATLLEIAPRLRESQRVFALTGGLHAAGLFDLSGKLIAVREDIGRHNAVDKLVGYALGRDILPLASYMMMVSGRLSFEIVQKAAAAGVPILAGVSAPSSLAVELAESAGLTLIGFLRHQGFNVYCGSERIAR